MEQSIDKKLAGLLGCLLLACAFLAVMTNMPGRDDQHGLPIAGNDADRHCAGWVCGAA